jgi:hypothetical protein
MKNVDPTNDRTPAREKELRELLAGTRPAPFRLRRPVRLR